MDSLMKVNASVVSFCGKDFKKNHNNFYINGRYKNEYENETDSIQVSIENSGEEYLFAVSEGLDRDESEQRTAVSIAREIAKLQEEFRNHDGELDSKIDMLKEHIQEINNIVYTMSLSNGEEIGKNTSIAGMILSGGKVAAINLGKSKVFMFRNGNLHSIFSDNKKTDRLLKMGILTDEQARMISGHYGMPTEESRIQIQKSKAIELQGEDLLVLCSEGFSDYVEEEKIQEMLMSKKDAGSIANMLVKEAIKRGSKNCLTIMVVRLDKTGTVQKSKPIFSRDFSKKLDKHDQDKKKKENMRTLIAVIISCIVIIAIMVVAYMCLLGKNQKKSLNGLVEITNQTADITDNTSTDTNQDQDTSTVDSDVQKSNHPDTYTVKSGDTLQGISIKCYGDINKYKMIMQANNITNPNNISIGQVLTIP